MGKTVLVAFIVIVVGAAAAFGGYRMGDGAGFERANQVRQEFLQQRQSASGQGQAASLGGGTGGGAGRNAGISAVVKSIDGDALTVTLGQRDVIVKLNDKTQVLKTSPGNRSELAVGAHVLITLEGGSGTSGGAGSGGGGAGGSNTFVAAAVTIVPPQ